MSSHRINYLRLIDVEARKQGIVSNWVPFALKAAPFIADASHAQRTAALFLQWLSGQSQGNRDDSAPFWIESPENPRPSALAA